MRSIVIQHVLARHRKTEQAVALRAHIVLACADGIANSAVAERLQVATAERREIARIFARQRLHGLL